MAAKAIAAGTRSGPNAPEGRTELFVKIDADAVEDEIFRAGVEAAPTFHTLRGDPYFLDGVPQAVD